MLLIPGGRKRPPEPENLHPWVLVAHEPETRFGTYLGNGFIATRIKGDGVGSQNGKPLGCFMAGLYDEERLIPTPTWSDLRFLDAEGKSEFRIDSKRPYEQTLDMRRALLTTRATWRSGRRTLNGSVEMIVSRAQPNAALVRAVLTPSFDGAVMVRVPLGNVSGRLKRVSAAEQNAAKFGAKSVMTASFVTRESGIGLGWASAIVSDAAGKSATNTRSLLHEVTLASVERGKPFTVSSFAALAAGPDPELARVMALDELREAVSAGPAFTERHKQEWAKLWERDIIIDGPPKDQQVLRSCRFYLLCSVREGVEWSIPPMGLSDDAFGGHVFWDADTWMFPALILQYPELARSIVDYRSNTLPGAMRNTLDEAAAGPPKPDEGAPWTGSPRGARYAWESGRTGLEATPPGLVYRHERHINGDVALAQWQYFLATGDLAWLRERGYPVISGTADYWLWRNVYVKDKNRYEIRQVVPPDENADLVNNSAYTNAIASMNLRIAARAASLIGKRPDPRWSETAAGMYIPFDTKNRRFAAFDGYAGLQAKQADTELLVYPLQFTIDAEDMTDIYRRTFEHYAPRVMPGGPAMTSSAHSVIAARLKNRVLAYTDFVKSYEPFIRGPFNYFNEKKSEVMDNMCFLTGAAGPIQAAIFGLAGARMDYFPEDVSASDLKFAPCLPEKWSRLKITGVRWRGQVFDVVVTKPDKVELVNVRTLP